jgi:hypothetical protein
MAKGDTFEAPVTVREDEASGYHEYGFEKDGAFVPLGSIASTTVASHVERTNDPDRPQTPPQ